MAETPRNRDLGNPGHPTQFAAHARTADGVTLGGPFTAWNPSAADEEIARIGWDQYTQRQTARTSTDPEVLHLLAWSTARSVDIFALSNPHTTDETFLSIVRHGTKGRRVLVADLTPLRAPVLELVDDEDAEVRSALAQNIETPADVLTRLATDSEETVVMGVAGNIAATPELLAGLADHKSLWVRRRVAANPSASESTLERLTHSQAEDVLTALASNPVLSPRLQLEMAYSGDPAVRLALARRPIIHHRALRALDDYHESEEFTEAMAERYEPHTVWSSYAYSAVL